MLVIVDFDDRCFQFRIDDLEPATRFRWLSKRKSLFEQVRLFDEPNNLFFDSWRDDFTLIAIQTGRRGFSRMSRKTLPSVGIFKPENLGWNHSPVSSLRISSGVRSDALPLPLVVLSTGEL